MEVSVHNIIIPKGRDPRGDAKFMEQLQSSIDLIGLIHPITVTPTGDGEFRLVSGRSRLHAVKSLGWDQVDVNVQPYSELEAELAELDENLVRHNLKGMEAVEAVQRRYELWTAMQQPAPKKPDPVIGQVDPAERIKDKQRVIDEDIEKHKEPSKREFARDTAAASGVSESTVRRDLSTGMKLGRAARKVLEGTPWINRKNQLEVLAKQPRSKQVRIAKVMTAHGIGAKEAAEYVNKKGMAGPRPWPPEFDAIFGKYRIEILNRISEISKARDAISRLSNKKIGDVEEHDPRMQRVRGAYTWIKKELDKVIHALREDLVPAGPCPKCDAQGCKHCFESGWHTEASLRRLDPGGYKKLTRW
jgi:ParB-like chromosome segregation protein Spo0J